MTREEMIALANQAGMSNLSLIDIGYLEAFVNLILEKASTFLDETSSEYYDGHEFRQVNPSDCAEVIRSMKV